MRCTRQTGFSKTIARERCAVKALGDAGTDGKNGGQSQPVYKAAAAAPCRTPNCWGIGTPSANFSLSRAWIMDGAFGALRGGGSRVLDVLVRYKAGAELMVTFDRPTRKI